MTEAHTYNVLFLCTGNSARSIMAEVLLNRVGRGRFQAFSAGSHPKGDVHPLTLHVLQEFGESTEGVRSKSWDEFSRPDSPSLDFVLTVCSKAAAEQCPIWTGQPMTAHWGIDDPVAAGGSGSDRRSAFWHAYRELHTRIRLFTGLQLERLDRIDIQRALKRIGQAK
jgi:arsenate reductase (thioredoxin)